ncbi:MAG: hypothetical protein ACT4UP_05910 [Gammaproteobacteria bacterium]
MTSLLQWVTATPPRAFLAAVVTTLASLFALPMAAWLPAGFVVLALLSGGGPLVLAAAAGAVLVLLWMLAPPFGTGPALAIAIAMLLPALCGGYALAATRSLNLVFQGLTLGASLLVLSIHGLLGEPEGALAPLLQRLEPVLQQVAATLSQWGVESTPAEIGAATARAAWATLGWMVLLHALLAQFAGLWGLGRLREPGLFAREFRRLSLGRFMAWALAAAFAVSLAAHQLAAGGWQAADDVVFVLAAAFLLQALAVVHGLRELQVIGQLPVMLAYVALLLAPVALVGIGFADTWVRFRERFVKR